MNPDYNLDKALDLLNSGGLLLDIRSNEEWCQGHLCGAIHIPTHIPPLKPLQRKTLAHNLFHQVQHLPKHFPLVLYCKKGVRASLARDMLYQRGYTNVIVLGGVDVPPLKNLFNKTALPPYLAIRFFQICQCM